MFSLEKLLNRRNKHKFKNYTNLENNLGVRNQFEENIKIKMGQTQSEEYQCEDAKTTTQNISDLEINSRQDSVSRGRNNKQYGKNQLEKCSAGLQLAKNRQHVRKLSDVSNRNIQLLSMKPRGERDAYADDLRNRRRSSLINLILGAPSSGPRFSDDLCSLSSHVSNFGIEFFPDVYRAYNTTISSSTVSLRREMSTEENNTGEGNSNLRNYKQQIDQEQHQHQQKRRRSSLGNLANINNTFDDQVTKDLKKHITPSSKQTTRQHQFRKPSLTSTLASIDLTSSFEKHDKSPFSSQFYRPPLYKAKETIFESVSQESLRDDELKTHRIGSKARINQTARVLRRTGSELSLYSGTSVQSGLSSSQNSAGSQQNLSDKLRETKLIIILQVCLPFILAGFGNMAAGLVLHHVAQWRVFQKIPIFFILLPPFIGLKGNIEMTLASRMSTLSNLNLLDSKHRWRKSFLSNLILIMSQAIGLSLFAALISSLCDLLISDTRYNLSTSWLEDAFLVVLASALATSTILMLLSSIIVSLSIYVANIIRVNPDNLSTLIAALYGDVSCVLIYGLSASWMYSLKEQGVLAFPISINIFMLLLWPFLLFIAHKFKETSSIAFTSIPPLMLSILVSMGSGAFLSMFVNKFKLIALYQPVVNGFGANLVAVQASRVSTWLWCSAIQEVPGIKESMEKPKTFGSLATFTEPSVPIAASYEDAKISAFKPYMILKKIMIIFWSFYNPSPNSIAARLLIIMLIPAQSLYFFVICLLTSANYVTVTWQLYLVYISLCTVQVFILLAICEPLMTLLMKYHYDPDIFGISLLMALADLIGTLCLVGAFTFLATIGDINASS